MNIIKAYALWRGLACCMLIQLMVTGANGQYLERDEVTRLLEFGSRYVSCFIELDLENKDYETKIFESLFDNNVALLNDFSFDDPSLMTPGNYFNRLKRTLFRNPDVRFDRIEISTYDLFLYAKANGFYYLWINKKLTYHFGKNNELREFTGWQTLKIRDDPRLGLLICAIDKVGEPADANRNHIPDSFEPELAHNSYPQPSDVEPNQYQQPTQQPIRRPYHVLQPARRRYYLPQPVQQPAYVRQPDPLPADFFDESHKPSYRFGLEGQGGTLPNWHNPMQSGIMGGLSLHWYTAGFLCLSVGYDYLDLPLDQDNICRQVQALLGSSTSAVRQVSVETNAYQLHYVYGSIGLGTYRHYRWIFSAEGLYGEVYSTPLLPNNLTVQVADGLGGFETSQVSLKPQPFPLYGGKATIGLGLGEKGRVRLLLKGVYLQGQASDQPAPLVFGPVDAMVPVAPVSIKAWGGELGVLIGIHSTSKPS